MIPDSINISKAPLFLVMDLVRITALAFYITSLEFCTFRNRLKEHHLSTYSPVFRLFLFCFPSSVHLHRMASLKPTPGITFLFRGFVRSLIPFTTIVISLLVLNDLSITIPAWTLISGTALCLPVAVALRIVIRDVTYRRRAAALGARPVPRCQGKWPGNLDLLKNMLKVSREGYPGV